MKKYIILSTIFFASCTGWIINFGGGGGTGSKNCDWHQDKDAGFYNVYLLPPDICDLNECSFENVEFVNFNGYSFYSIFEAVHNGFYGDACELKWDVEIVPAKLCSYNTQQSHSVILDDNNYANRISYQNVLEGTPYVPDSNFIYPYDHKHTLTFQIKNVSNRANNTEGTITWKMTWTPPSSIGVNEWGFTFPNDGLKGTYTPNTNAQRYIYINGDYELI